MKKLTEKEQRRRIAKAAKNIENAEAALASEENREAYLQFMARYSLCELGYKTLLAEHIRDLGKTPTHDLTIKYKQISTVLKRVGLDEIDSKTIEEIFNATNKIGERHGRGLRNSLTHAPNQEAIEELRKKEHQINAAMDSFLAVLKNKSMSRESKKEQS